VVSLVTQYSPIRIDVNKKGLSSATFEYFLRFSAPKAKKLSLLFVQISTQEKPPPLYCPSAQSFGKQNLPVCMRRP
jgi:hypothetical protein